ncbi:Asp-tRNA(Asn)/Glu-tRNA(Gln) amidotransferase subunit GatA [Methanococcus maripaludis]|uniref:Glutamyl-tRNA(Gln) amidotransferase subunit A n=3 Tax=Methanococcus maripaludis TaxID=39152 RepID=GATA_METMP|nr:Asp-tRNA(Asn)/Glu-tRNA(Gln) amidotransferase subunit GatA [Methanococcus maripaludis]Q6LX43.1 RecName: Full=Glutamyl-tRNA(Gln) amidotransferase subunit A; Short=Glu-ADT subunit A [Methanococcus maripaludis S2]MBA2847410.1 aspartyl-tRNA(Asn)/glutamyl-tRNA(Gln) amidotransferase subunit A [Methanococcus maripaludis]MBA2857518.1 aspartyl-tRNA(Asn)/glutamyl-tRNA(Gln) amidotransferase subunit A [Methanococcus maripaludis]MBB6067261.1 aspartyl-tRNA(Asn)/glutamyl-tRNA(Gln) amidotransferase subunit A
MITDRVSDYLEKIEKSDVNAFIDVNGEKVLKEAEELEKNDTLKNKPLYGKIVAVKSNINVKGYKISCASKTLEKYVGTYDATVVKKLRSQGALIVGMTNMDEFAGGSSGETSCYGPTKNPAAMDRIPGGSSSGSAAAVAADLCDMAIGSDTGGSIRNPASHCGIVGFKPSYGVVSRQGLCDLAMSFDQIGPLTKNAEDALVLTNAIKGIDRSDSTSLETPKFEKKDISNYKIGVVKEFMDVTDEKIRNEIEKGIEVFKDMGCKIVDLSYKYIDLALPTYYLINYVEFFSATRKYDGRRYGEFIEEACGEEVLRRILIGKHISEQEFSGKYYKKALQARKSMKKEMLGLFNSADLIVGPTVPKLPHKLGEDVSPMEMYAYDVLTVPTNICGICSGVVRCGNISGVPVGLQIQGAPLEDEKVLSAMIEFEKNY